ncbi:S-adenosyl-L-methionine-dependent methyltransferase [Boeremia exigua]|uniref:S-adenosyl-L-methionine-dependent methyltransferase n=1 Tax=Boeremia exigua TaxID=749465 RepID=UPI001E8D006F|nr:S-adenosyl-L-methionine-dependent methyltransferase [Boeremia exigua]KAH6618641.1 S-adenosyl-L-methionine-dependent methyltransferase [Boeremia exigua]
MSRCELSEVFEISESSDEENDCVEVKPIDLESEDQHEGLRNLCRPTGCRQIPAYNAIRARPSPQQDQSDKELRFHRLPDDTIIRVGDFVELQCPPHRQLDPKHSGDYLRIKGIFEDRRTSEVTLRGLRFQREKYAVGRSFVGKTVRLAQERKMNDRIGARLCELVMCLTVREDDNRPAEVQSEETIPISEVQHKQAVILTNRPYPMLSYREQPSLCAHLHNQSHRQIRLHIFKNGPLVCRWSRTSTISPNGKKYGMVDRYFTRKEVTTPQHLSLAPLNNGYLPITPHRRTLSVEEIATATTQRSTLPSKNQLYTYFDMYCGGGGASRGADQAGLKVLGGLDHNEIAMNAWERNNPGAIPLCMDSFAFLKNDMWKIIGRCDFLNISNPCQTYSSAHTREGKNDEINTAQLEVIKIIIEALKPRVVVIENTANLVNMERNRKYFNRMLNDVHSAGSGYNLRYKVVNMADFGLPQERKRLLLIAARRDTPLPPFPKPTHGPPGSGLKPYVRIGDALKVLERLGERAERDGYHKLHREVSQQEQAYDPYAEFVDCIMTSGVECRHWSGEKFTPRDLALLQSLPVHHCLAGSWPQAIKQVGNMFPPIMAELVYRTCAQTLEAWDNGFLDADDDIDDLNITLIEKGVDIPEAKHTPTSVFDLTGPAAPSPYRYLSRPVFSDATHVKHSSAWSKRLFSGSGKSERKRSFYSGPLEDDDRDTTPSPAQPPFKRATTSSREETFWKKHGGKTIDLSNSDED